MRLFLSVSIMMGVFVNSLGQGVIVFNNRNLQDPVTGVTYHAPVSLPDGRLASGGGYTAGLFLMKGGSLELVVTTPFSDSGPGFFRQPISVAVPGVPIGAAATFRARVWETSAGSYENAVASGQHYFGEFGTRALNNELFVERLGDPSSVSGITPPDTSGILPLVLQVPEPGGMMLFGLGALVLVAVRLARR